MPQECEGVQQECKGVQQECEGGETEYEKCSKLFPRISFGIVYQLIG